MVELAIAGSRAFTSSAARSSARGPYTIDTVLELSVREPGTRWCLIVGQDQLARLPTWHRWRELVALVQIAVAARAGEAVQAPVEVAALGVAARGRVAADGGISATDIRARVRAGQGHHRAGARAGRGLYCRARPVP